jgi:hypothetical protein
MNHYPFLSITSKKEEVTYSSLKHNSVNVYIEKPGVDDFCSLSFELTNDDINLIKTVGYSDTEIEKWTQKIINMKDIFLELAKERAEEEQC